MAIARLLSVTVSMAADNKGMPSSIRWVSRVRVSQSAGRRTEDAAGFSSTSSKVSASRIACQLVGFEGGPTSYRSTGGESKRGIPPRPPRR